MPFSNIPLITATSFDGFDIKFEELNARLNHVKKEFGMRRAVSTQSLTGETRTFAEILDLQVETIVLYYLEIQGIAAKQLRLLREHQVQLLNNCLINLQGIDEMCYKYRQIGVEILELLRYLERNSVALRKILHRHDALFDQKMGSMYFDTRFSENKNSQLRQLYHQEGVKALVASIRRGFEELYDARKAFSERSANDSPLLGRSFDGRLRGSSRKVDSSGIKLIPKVSFRKRLASFSNLNHLLTQEQNKENSATNNSNNGSATSNNNPNGDNQPDSMKRNVLSTNNLEMYLDKPEDTYEITTRPRSVSDLEPILHQITDVANKLLKTQNTTTMEFLTSYSAMGLDLAMGDIRRAARGEDISEKVASIRTNIYGLYLNLFVTFIYLMNQYIVAPTSAQYANMLGMSPSMSGMIIGLAPVAALVSSLLYSMWSNSSFKNPLLLSIICGVVGNYMYAAALQNNSVMMLFLGRLLTGFGGTRVVSRRYIADHVATEDRLMASTQFVTAGALGLAFGPLLAAFIERSNLNFDVHGFINPQSVLFRYDNVTAPGWIMTLLWGVSFFAVLFYFEEPQIAEKKTPPTPSAAGYGSVPKEDIVFVETGNELWENEIELKPSTKNSWRNNNNSNATNETQPLLSTGSSTPTNLRSHSHSAKSGSNNISLQEYSKQAFDDDYHRQRPPPMNHLGSSGPPPREPWCWEFISIEVYILLFILTVNKTGQELSISSMPFLGREIFQLGVEAPGYYMAVIGALVLPVNLFVNQLLKDADEKEMVLKLSYMTMLGLFFICHFGAFGEYSLFQYFFGTAIIFTTLNALEGIIMSLLAKLISPDLAKGTFNSGLLATEAGTLGRVFGDMAIVVFGNETTSALLVNRLYFPLGLLIVMTVVLIQNYHKKFVD